MLAIRLYRDPRVPALLKSIVPAFTALYVLSPVDLIPDFLLGLGQVDDVGILGLALLVGLKLIRRLAPADVVAAHLDEMGLQTRARPSGHEAYDSESIFEARYTTGGPPNRQTGADRGRRTV
jgi:hypothetical protein